METPIHILLVEDDLITAAALNETLTAAGFQVSGIARSHDDALRLAEQSRFDLALVDIHLAGRSDGIALAEMLLTMRWMPLIFLTGNTDEATFERAKAIYPAAFLNKPFRPTELVQHIRLVMHNHERPEPTPLAPADGPVYLPVKSGLVKVEQAEIYYLEAAGNYTNLFLTDAALQRFGPEEQRHKSAMLIGNLGYVSTHLSPRIFRRLSRSLVVNINHIDRIEAQSMLLGRRLVALSASARKTLLDQLQVVRTR